MINNFYTLKALVEEWRNPMEGSVLGDVFSQEPDELTLAFAGAGGDQMIRIGTRRPLQFMFRTDGYSKARRNVATLFEAAVDRNVIALRIADRDRWVFLDLEGGAQIRMALFGPRANVLLVEAGHISAAFRNEAGLTGTVPPEPRPAPSPTTFEEFRNRWSTDRKSVAHAAASAWPVFDRTLAAEAAVRAGLDPDAAPTDDADVLRALFDAALSVREDLRSPRPHIYWDADEPVHFSLIALSRADGLRPEAFGSVDEAVRTYVRRALGRRRFHELYDPMAEALRKAADHYRSGAERMLGELLKESRADQYERWGHLLMAAANDVRPGTDHVELADLFGDAGPVTIPLDPARSPVENAEAYYDRARRTRRSREEAESRLIDTEARAEKAEQLLATLGDVEGLADVRSFRKMHAEALSHFLPDEKSPGDRIPFRRYALGGGYEAWVGRNARQNDELTFRHAQKYDLWMHARGVPGSHVVLRLPNRDAKPDRRIVYAAAAVAAHYSKARGSALVPVMIAERKYVRKPRGAGPGAVAVEREDVLLVEPRLPG